MTPQHPAAPEGETDASEWVAALTEAHRDSYPVGNIHHGTPERPDWGTFCVECKESWPCDVSRLIERLRVVEGERDAAMAEAEMALRMHDVQWSRAESAEAAHAALAAGVEALADEWEQVAGRHFAAIRLRALLAGGGA